MNVTVLRPQPPMRAVVYGPRGRYTLYIADLSDLVKQAIEKGLVKVE